MMLQKVWRLIIIFLIVSSMLLRPDNTVDAQVIAYDVMKNAEVTSSSNPTVPTYPIVTHTNEGDLQITFTGNNQRVFLKLYHVVDFSNATSLDMQFITPGELMVELWDKNLNTTIGEWWAGNSHEYAAYGPKAGYTNVDNSFPLQITSGSYQYSGEIGNTGTYRFNSMMLGNLSEINYVSIGTNSSSQFLDGGTYTVILKKCQIVGIHTITESINRENTPLPSTDAQETNINTFKVENIKNVKWQKLSKGRLRIKWKKVPNASGYQIQYALNKKFTKKAKKKLLTKTKTTLKKLKRKKTYYVRVRAYRLDGTKKVYGKWSKRVKVKVK